MLVDPQLHRYEPMSAFDFQIIDFPYSHDKSKGFGDGGVGMIRRFMSIHECNSICVAGQWSN